MEVKRWLLPAVVAIASMAAIFFILRAVWREAALAMDWIPIGTLAVILAGEMLLLIYRGLSGR